MLKVAQTETFSRWLRRLRDREARQRITSRLLRVEQDGHFGDSRSVGGSVSEMRIGFGPGYRVYYTRRGENTVILLCGGDKDSQQRDIGLAQELVKEV